VSVDLLRKGKKVTVTLEVAEDDEQRWKKLEEERREALKSSAYAVWNNVAALNAELERLSRDKSNLVTLHADQEITFEEFKKAGAKIKGDKGEA